MPDPVTPEPVTPGDSARETSTPGDGAAGTAATERETRELPTPGPVARVLLVLLGGYRRWVSPLLGPRCRFAPSCSSYALQAVTVHGAGRGSWLAVRRIARCHPFHPGGHDPVPPVRRSGVEARPTRLVPRPSTRTPAPSAVHGPVSARPAAHPDASEQTRA